MINTVESLRGLYVALGGNITEVANLTTIPELLTEISTVAQAAATELPAVKSQDNGKVLTVVNSKWQKADAYSLPTASSSTLGGVKVGDGLSISNGKLSADKKKTQMNNWINGMISESQGVCSFTSFTAPTAAQLKTAWANGEEPVLYIAAFTVGTTLFPTGVVLPLVPTICLMGGNPFDTGTKPTFSGLVKADDGLYAVFVGFDVASGFSASASCEVVKLTE